MRKLYSALATVALMSVSLSANAQFTAPESNPVLESSDYNMRLYKNIDFNGKTINGEPVDDWVFDTTQTTDEIKFNSYTPYRCTTEGISNLWQAVGNIAWASGYGLRNTGSGPRGLLLSEMKAGQILVLQGRNGGYNTGQTSTDYNSFCIPNGSRYNASTNWAWELFDPIQVEDISDEIHQIQIDAAREEQGDDFDEEYKGDGLLYLQVANDGWVSIPLERSASVLGLQIWIAAGADEAVTAPSLILSAVNNNNRAIEFKPGESTLGLPCTTWWGVTELDEVALVLIDTDEIDHYDYVYERDDEGNIVYDDNGEPVVAEEIPVYKQILDPAAAAEGIYGDRVYEGGATTIYGDTDDADGDGYVTIQAATVSESGAYSEISTFRLSVQEITLNAPTFTLVNIDGTNRTYAISWNNNTLCSEDYTILVEGDDGEVAVEYPLSSIGEPVTVQHDIKATVSVEGYLDGVGELPEVDGAGIDMTLRTDAGNGETTAHNWDFQSLSQETLDKINLKVVDHWAVYDEDGVTELRTYTNEQVANDEVDDDDFDLIKEVPVYFGWDAADSRNTNRHWRTWIPTYEPTVDEDGNPVLDDNGEQTQTLVSSVYAEEQTGLFNGLVVDNSHPNYSTLAIFTDQSGLFFMSKGTIEVTPVQYGEYVLVNSSAGTSVTQHLDPSNPLVLTINQNVYVYSIDIFTYEDLPDAIQSFTSQDPRHGQIFSIDGRLVSRNAASLNSLQPGLYIVDGKKVLVK